MPITWKKRQGLKPQVLLDRIRAVRNVGTDGGVSFTGFVLEDALPAIQSMLAFPDVASEVSESTLVWKAVTGVKGELTAEAFLRTINSVLSKEISSRELEFHVLTSMSVGKASLPFFSEGAKIRLLDEPFPRKYGCRADLIASQPLPVHDAPEHYCRTIIKVRAKSPKGAMTKAFRTLDLTRGIWCLLANVDMEIIGRSWYPINRIRLGSIHTIHRPDGSPASEDVWFDPNYAPVPTSYTPTKTDVFSRNSRYIAGRIDASKYSDLLKESVLRYVRALDERDHSVAFLGLWGAIESLTSPGHADHDKVVSRCSFLHHDRQYHRQVLEHLREFRNRSVHAGDQSENAKTHCYQLQRYFRALIFFHIRNATFFKSLDEVNIFLDLPSSNEQIKRSQQLLARASKFVA